MKDRKSSTERSEQNDRGYTVNLPPEVSLPILVFIDMFAVALVVPLLVQYYKRAGVTSATQRELLSSVFSSSQIIGGLLLGAASDAKLLKKKTILFVSFGGSAIAYSMISYGGFTAIILSRILVGLVKQTMTVTTSLLTRCTTKENRTKYMGRLDSCTTAAFILGPSTGALLFKYVDHKAPALFASLLFLVNMVLAKILLREDLEENTCIEPTNDDDDDDDNCDSKTLCINKNASASVSASASSSSPASFWNNLKTCCSSQSLAAVIACLLLFSWMYRATSYANMGSYYEDMYGVEPHARGYIQSYQRILAFIVQSTLIQPILARTGGEHRAVYLAAILLAGATFLETKKNFYIFLVVTSPSIALSISIMGISLRSLLTQSAPEDAIFSIFAALDVLKNATAITVPFYRAFLFKYMTAMSDNNDDGNNTESISMDGDPDPVSWILCAGCHWIVAALIMVYLLGNGQKKSRPESLSMKKDL